MGDTWHGIPREKVPWYPIIDNNKCAGCKICVDLCPHGTYDWDNAAKKPIVKNPNNCAIGCTNCVSKCPRGAISFPPLSVLEELLQNS